MSALPCNPWAGPGNEATSDQCLRSHVTRGQGLGMRLYQTSVCTPIVLYLPPNRWSVLLLHNFCRSDVLEIYDDPVFEKYTTSWKGMLNVGTKITSSFMQKPLKDHLYVNLLS